MLLTSVEMHPRFFLGWLNFLILPSRRQTEKARRELLESKDKDFIFPANPLAHAFAEGKLNIGTTVKVDGRILSLKGVYPKTEYPAAMVFWDDSKGCYVQFNFLPCYGDYKITN